jgi:hypothetical protein
MARAIDWAIARESSHGGAFLVTNVGSDAWNYQIKELAEAVAQAMPHIEVSINKDAPPDRRSYKVSFEKFKQLAPDHQPRVDLRTAISELSDGLRGVGFNDENFRQSNFIRLNTLTSLKKRGLLTDNLEWAFAVSPSTLLA